MKFAKLQGSGNDFVLRDLRSGSEHADGARFDEAQITAEGPELARELCDRHFGVGADGVLTLLDGDGDGGERMIVHNADGSRPEMCGNGARCAALWIATLGCVRPASEEVLLLTDAGPRPSEVEAKDPFFAQVEIGMGEPRVEAERAFQFSTSVRAGTAVSMGNPHRVFFLGDAPQTLSAGRFDPALASLRDREGPALCAAEDANIELVQSLGSQRFRAAVWERGAGATLACGTGACAVAAAAVARGLANAGEPIEVELPGGALRLRFEKKQLWMRGPAELVFRGDTARAKS